MEFNLVLASTSPFRQQLLAKLMLPFNCVNPNIDESPAKDETALSLVKRLAEQKAFTGAQLIENKSVPQLIIGSDQVALINDQIIGKPHTVDNAIAQLSAASGQAITFYTGLTRSARCRCAQSSTRMLNQQILISNLIRGDGDR